MDCSSVSNWKTRVVEGFWSDLGFGFLGSKPGSRDWIWNVPNWIWNVPNEIDCHSFWKWGYWFQGVKLCIAYPLINLLVELFYFYAAIFSFYYTCVMKFYAEDWEMPSAQAYSAHPLWLSQENSWVSLVSVAQFYFPPRANWVRVGYFSSSNGGAFV